MEIEAEQNGAVQRLESDWSCNRNLSLAAAGLSVLRTISVVFLPFGNHFFLEHRIFSFDH